MQPLDDPLTGSPRLHLLGGARPNRASTWKYHGRPCLQPPGGRLRFYRGLGRPLAAHLQKYPNNPDMMRERAERDEEKRRERAGRDEEKRRARERKKQERGIGRVPNRGAQLQRCAGCVQPGMSASSAPPAASAIVADASSCVLAEARA